MFTCIFDLTKQLCKFKQSKISFWYLMRRQFSIFVLELKNVCGVSNAYHVYNTKISAESSQYIEIPRISVTRLGDLLDFGQLFKVCGNNWFAKISHILWQFL